MIRHTLNLTLISLLIACTLHAEPEQPLMALATTPDHASANAAERDLAAQQSATASASPVQLTPTPGGATAAVDANPGSWSEFASQHWGKTLTGIIGAAGITWYLVDKNQSSKSSETAVPTSSAQAPQTGSGNVTINNSGPGTVVVEYQSPHNNGE